MGRVYPAEQVEERRLPEIGAQELAGRFILNEFFEPDPTVVTPDLERTGGRNYWEVQSGMVYGSVAMGTHNRRSDVDVLVNYSTPYARTALPLIRQVLAAAEEKFNVSVEANVLPHAALHFTYRHNIDLLFAEHLLAVQQKDQPRWSYNWPVDGVMFRRIDFSDIDRVRAIAVRYAGGKARQFDQALTAYRGTANLATLQRAYELPGSLGRKVLAAASGTEVPDNVISGSRTAGIQNLLKKITESNWPSIINYASVDEIEKLTSRDREYSELLESAYDGTIDADEYRGWIEGQYLESLVMARNIAQGWMDILAFKLDIRNYEEELKEQGSDDFDY